MYCCNVCVRCVSIVFFFFKQKTAYEMRISDCSSDVCSSDLVPCQPPREPAMSRHPQQHTLQAVITRLGHGATVLVAMALLAMVPGRAHASGRSEEHTSELQSLMRISYAVFCLKKKKKTTKMNKT